MNENNVNVKNKNKGALIGVSVGAIAFLFLIGLLLFYFFIFNKPKQVFTTALDKVYALAKENSQNASRMSGNVKIKTDLHSNDANTEKILDVLNHITINMDYNMDAKMKKMHMVLDTKYKEKELLDASVDILNNNLYVYLQDVYSKYLFVPAEGIEEMFATMEKEKDYEIVLKYFKNALEKSLKEKYFKKENTILSINGENVNVINNQLILNEENLKEIKNTLSEELNKEEFIKIFSNIIIISDVEV